MLAHLEKFQKHVVSAGFVVDNFQNETYINYAEKSLKCLIDMGIQNETGFVRDPFDAVGVTYTGKKLELFYFHAEARFCGALGQLIQAGRMTEYADNLYLSYNHLMKILAYDFEPAYYAEFWIKELVFAYNGLKSLNYPKLDRDLWEKITWRKYGFHYYNNYHNGVAYAIASEATMISAGLGGSKTFFDEWMPVLFDSFNHKLGMYLEPGAPMSYDMITKQQILFAITNGADGEHKAKALELCELGAVSSLYMQSVSGQMPFGGRTNQFLCVDTFLSSFFEMMSSISIQNSKLKEAGIYKRAAHNAVKSIEPWLNMKPFRHIRQGFSPEMGHGIDSGGVYTVYGLLTSSMLGTSYFQSIKNNQVQSVESPAETGGFIFATDDDFHKVFASCGGYHIEIDTGADIEKDATGLGRLHKKGVFPETALSGSCTPFPTYSYAFNDIDPVACAIGPAWLGRNDEVMSLADIPKEMIKSSINIMCEEKSEVSFSIKYEIENDFIEETYHLSENGLLYSVKGEVTGLHITIPLIQTDGMEKGRIRKDEEGLTLIYRGASFKVICEHPELTGEQCANRNGIYKIGRIMDHMVKLQLLK